MTSMVAKYTFFNWEKGHLSFKVLAVSQVKSSLFVNVRYLQRHISCYLTKLGWSDSWWSDYPCAPEAVLWAA